MQAHVSASLSYQLEDSGHITHTPEGAYVLRVSDLPRDKRPRERLLSAGPRDLSTAELVAVLLGVGTRREEVLGMSQRILKEYGERAIMHETDPARLSESLQIPIAKACQLVACFELGRRYFAEKAGKPVYIRTPEQAYQHLVDMGKLQKEHCRGLYLSSRYELIHEETISVGSLTANIVHPREVFRPAVEHGAVAVIVAHNHPSGDPTPTPDDHIVTSQLRATGTILGIELLDHLVIGAAGFECVTQGDKS